MSQFKREKNGLALAESFFGEKVGADLIARVKGAPYDHLILFKEMLRESGMAPYSTWTEQPLEGSVREGLNGMIASETLLLDHKVPISTRSGLTQLLLVAPVVVIADPIWAWADSMGNDGRWHHRSAWDEDSTPAAEALAQILAGLAPLRDAIESGSVRIVRPPAETTIEMNRLFVNPTTNSMLQKAFPGWGLKQTAEGRDIPDSFNDFTLMSNLDYYFNPEERWEAMAKTIFPTSPPSVAVPLLRKAIALDDYTALNSLTPAPTPSISQFFDVATQNSPDSSPAFKLDLPIMNLTLSDALTMRRDEEVFSILREALVQLISVTGASEDEESANEYASRLSRVALTTFEKTEIELERQKSRGTLLGRGVPSVASLAFGVGMKVVGIPAPGGSAVVKSTVGRAVRSQKHKADAASAALRYVSNVKLTGHL